MGDTAVSKDLTAKIAECKSPEDVLALAKEEGIELSDSQLEEVSGGWGGDATCPKCGSQNFTLEQPDPHSAYMYRECHDCGHRW